MLSPKLLSAEQHRIESMVDHVQDWDFNVINGMAIQLNSYSDEVQRHHARLTVNLIDEWGYALVVAYSKAMETVERSCHKLEGYTR